MDKKIFFDCVRNYPSNGKLSKRQVQGMETILNEWQQRQLQDIRWLGYILATAYHETAFTMEPIDEYGKGYGREYGIPDPETGQVYYGRGFVQVTWKANYLRFSELLGIDLLSQPELALEQSVATSILFEGMINGLFTGKALRHYFREDSDWYNARRIVNRLDRAEQIARYGRAFWYALLMAAGEVEQALLVPKNLEYNESDGLAAEVQELARQFRQAKEFDY
ncbi:MAG: hypothetical protein E6Q85_05930 [Thiothrix sp.]|nr:MAG: hypothetical protein E6Q85_05930 [Thiothrix sp.]